MLKFILVSLFIIVLLLIYFAYPYSGLYKIKVYILPYNKQEVSSPTLTGMYALTSVKGNNFILEECDLVLAGVAL